VKRSPGQGNNHTHKLAACRCVFATVAVDDDGICMICGQKTQFERDARRITVPDGSAVLVQNKPPKPLRDDTWAASGKQINEGGRVNSPDPESGLNPGVPAATARQPAPTAVDLLACFKRAQLSPSDMPTLEMCESLLPFLPPGCPTDIEQFGASIGKKSAQAAEDLLQALPEVEAYWRAHLEAAKIRALTAAVRRDPSKIWNEAVFEPLRDLCRNLHRCMGLLTQSPDPFPENRGDAMDALLALFVEAARHTTPNRKKIGTSAEGPASRFIKEAICRLGYGSISGDAVSQHFKRKRSRTAHRT
jgi:hypothetical protein